MYRKPQATSVLAEQKLAAFVQIEPEFILHFQFLQDVHGQRRFPSLAINDLISYLHSLWICECKDRLLSVPQTIERYNGMLSLSLLRAWQVDEALASVIAFLESRLDMQPFAMIGRQIDNTERDGYDATYLARLRHGRTILLNRSMNFLHLLDALFTPTHAQLMAEVREICLARQLTPEQIDVYLTSLQSNVYQFAPHPLLAQRNMQIMNQLGAAVTTNADDLPGHRTQRIRSPLSPHPSYAEIPIAAYTDLGSVMYNNIANHRFTDVADGLDMPHVDSEN
jgi:hypothetical protein